MVYDEVHKEYVCGLYREQKQKGQINLAQIARDVNKHFASEGLRISGNQVRFLLRNEFGIKPKTVHGGARKSDGRRPAKDVGLVDRVHGFGWRRV